MQIQQSDSVKVTKETTTIVNGKILMENRKINNIDKKEIIKKCAKIMGKID